MTKARVGENIVLALAPLSVLPEYQGKEIGTALIKEGHKIDENLREVDGVTEYAEEFRKCLEF